MDLKSGGRQSQQDRGIGRDMSAIQVPAMDGVRHETSWRLEKRWGDIDAYVEEHLPSDLKTFRALGMVARSSDKQAGLAMELRSHEETLSRQFHAEVTPYEVIEIEGNLLVTVGIDIMLDLFIGGGGTVFSNANAYLGVGDSSTAEAVGQTDLLAASNKLRKAMNGSYPSIASPVITFQSTFGSSEANFTWAEVGTFNAGSAGTMFNRKVQALGTKSAGATWTLTEDITFS